MAVRWFLDRGGPPIHTRHAHAVLLGALLLAGSPTFAASTGPITLLREDGLRREILPLKKDRGELVSLELVISGLGVHTRTDRAAGTATLSKAGREISLFSGKSLAAVEGDLRLLSSPTLLQEGRWMVPVDGLPKLLAPLLRRPVVWRPAQRVLLVGAVSIPKVEVRNYVSGDSVRVVLEASEKVRFQAQQESGRVTVTIPSDVLDVSFTEERFTGGIVEKVQFVGGRENLFAVVVGPRFKDVQAFEQDKPPRLVLEFQASSATADGGRTVPRPTPTPEPERQGVGGITTVVIDPGHGGLDFGAQGPTGTYEKDVTLSIARRLRAALADRLGVQAFLTRTGDQQVDLDERAAIANNYKADLFISIHTNASRSHGAKGSEVYFLSYQATDEASRQVAMLEGASLPEVPGPAGSDLAFILWDMAQAEHLQESSALASRLQEELADVTGSESRGVKQAPFRVLVGAGMPAALVEVAFISNPEEEKLLISPSHQRRVVSALLRGIATYRSDRARRTGIGSPAARRGRP